MALVPDWRAQGHEFNPQCQKKKDKNLKNGTEEGEEEKKRLILLLIT